MAHQDFAARIARLEAGHPTAQAMAAAPGKAKTRRERLERALQHLHRGGVHGGYAYPPAFRPLAKMGLGPRPLHYWSAMGLFVFGFCLFAGLGAGLIWASGFLDHAPRAVRGMMSVPLEINLAICAGLSVIVTVQHKLKARQIGLPRWRDL